jgi:hypothetical protein
VVARDRARDQDLSRGRGLSQVLGLDLAHILDLDLGLILDLGLGLDLDLDLIRLDRGLAQDLGLTRLRHLRRPHGDGGADGTTIRSGATIPSRPPQRWASRQAPRQPSPRR